MFPKDDHAATDLQFKYVRLVMKRIPMYAGRKDAIFINSDGIGTMRSDLHTIIYAHLLNKF